MAFKAVTDLGTENVIALGGFNKKLRKDNPTSVEGYYLGSRQVTSPKSKTGFAAIHVFQTPKGNLGVWGKTDLDRKMQGLTPGIMTRVTFVGEVPTKNNPMYKYKVEIDEDNTIEVSELSAGSTDAGYEATDSDDASSDQDTEEETDDSDDDAAQAAALAAAERKAKVDALLRGSKNSVKK